MSVVDVPQVVSEVAPKVAGRPLRKRVMHLLRRGHLYFGLLLFPWAILYGITAFLFNHPTAFSEQPTATFDRAALAGTPAENLPAPQTQAELVLAKLNEAQKPTTPYKLAGDAKYSGREFAFATVKANGLTVNVLLDVKNGGGTVRSNPTVETKTPEKAPFATGSAKSAPTRGGGGAKGPRPTASSEGIQLDSSVADRFKAAIPTILERTGFPAGEVTVTSVPDISFPVEAEGRTWTANYNSLTGAVSGAPEGEKPPTELGWRRFLLRLHLAHGYPGEVNGRFAWALIVDAMAFTMCFWGLTGLLMWWQIKATRVFGFLILVASAAAATAIAFAMHTILTSG